jgi:hypothetical protein
MIPIESNRMPANMYIIECTSQYTHTYRFHPSAVRTASGSQSKEEDDALAGALCGEQRSAHCPGCGWQLEGDHRPYIGGAVGSYT